jgi:blue light- and temperature-responsive anti-repressor
MMARYWRLIYTSRRTCNRADSEAELLAIEQIAARNNQRSNLMGALVGSHTRFAQILEGPRDALERTFETICCDHRHEDVLVMNFAPVEERLFTDFGLQALRFDEDSLSEGEPPHEAMLAFMRASIERLDATAALG